MAMILTLVAVSLNDQPLSQPITAVFDSRGGTIGRADHNTMALPDPQRHVSRLQAEVVAQEHGFLIRNVGSANPIVIGTRSLAHGETQYLVEGDALRVGPYLLKVQVENSPSESPTRPSLQRLTPPAPARTLEPTSPTAPAPLPGNAFSDLLGGGAAKVGSDNPFADLLGPPVSAPSIPMRSAAPPTDPFADLMPAPSGVAPQSPALAAPAQPVARLPDDFDPFATPAPKPAASAPAPVDPFADLMPAAAAPSIDAMFGLNAPSDAKSDPLAHFVAGSSAPTPSSASVSTDPLAMFVPSPAPIPAAVQLPADRASALHDAWQPPRQATVSRPPSPEPLPRSADDNTALWAAFCEGAGITPSALPTGGVAQRLRDVGRILRNAIEGTLQLIAVRATTKHELRAGMTVIRQINNNPLKFSPDAKAGLEQMLQPPMRGFLDGPAAMNDAMQDLVGHSIGTVAGMRAAVEGMLDRFAPDALEKKLVGGSVLDSLLPMNRKARLWDLYLQHHESIRAEAHEDFHTLFGKAFLAAYEQQVERLRRDTGGKR